MSISDATSLFSALMVYVYQPVATRVSLLRSLPSKADELSSVTARLGGLREEVTRTVADLVQSDPRKEQSALAGLWLESVRALVEEEYPEQFEREFKARRSSRNCLGCGCWSNYGLAKKAVDLLHKAEELRRQREAFTDDQLVSSIPEMVLVLKTLKASSTSLSERITRLTNLKTDTERKVNSLILNKEQRMEHSSRVKEWSEKVESAIASSTTCTKICKTIIIVPCNVASSSSHCSSEIGACDGCIDKYKLGKEINRLLEQVENLLQIGNGFTDDHLVSFIPEMVLVLRTIEDNSSSLSQGIRKLKSLKTDMERKVESLISTNQQLMEPSSRVKEWLEQAEFAISSSRKCAKSLETILPSNTSSSHTPSSSYSCCVYEEGACDGCRGRYRIGKEMIRLLEKIQILKDEGDGLSRDEHLVVAAAPAMVEEIPIYHEVVGQKQELDRALQLIGADDEEISVIGIHGMGGRGKSILMHRINNEFVNKRDSGFDIVISLTAGRDMVLSKLRMEIGRRLGLSLSDLSEEEQARRILRKLESMSFLLLLDDLWMELDLGRLGIPPLLVVSAKNKGGEVEKNKKRRRGRRKMVVSARTPNTCRGMGVRDGDLVQMGLLNDEESWDLFCLHSQVNEILPNPQIERLAREVMDHCGRLPLAVTTVGRAMVGIKELCRWQSARSKLVDSAHTFSDIKDKVLLPLRFSFERLHNEAMRQILFVCSWMPDHWSIHDLAREVALEGLLDDDAPCSSFERAAGEALALICGLVDCGLLMWGDDVYWERKSYVRFTEKQYVKLHDCVRDMLLWLMDTEDDKYPKMVTWPGGRWEERARRVSVEKIDHPEEELAANFASCVNLRCGCFPEPDGFFDSMPCLRILHLRGIKELAGSSNIASLTNLRYLDLDETPIEELPQQVGDLRALVYLSLNGTGKLVRIPCECISRLDRLEVMAIQRSAFQWTWDGVHLSSRQVGLKDLEELIIRRGMLQDIQIALGFISNGIIDGLANVRGVLKHSITNLRLRFGKGKEGMDLDKVARIVATMGKLATLELVALDQPGLERRLENRHQQMMVQGFFPVLSRLSIAGCSGVYDLSWARHIPCLEYLYVRHCGSITSLFRSEENTEILPVPFASLKQLFIVCCHGMDYIAESPMLLPSLELLAVYSCPQLKKLPFDGESAARMRKIVTDEETWNGVECDQVRFLHFVEKWKRVPPIHF